MAKGRLRSPVSWSPSSVPGSLGTSLPTTQAPMELAATAPPMAASMVVCCVSFAAAGGWSNIGCVVTRCHCPPVRWKTYSACTLTADVVACAASPLTAHASLEMVAATPVRPG